MNFNQIDPQECYFYEGRWNEETVNVLIRVLMDDVKTGDWDVNCENVYSLGEAQAFINVMMDKDYTWDEILALKTMLKKRYTVKKSILDTEGVWWDPKYNHIYVPNWEDLFKADEFAKAFYHKGDVQFDCLKSLFGNEYDASTDVITISSDGQVYVKPNNADDPFVVPDSDDEDEVQSPDVAARKVPHSRLFASNGKNECRALISLESRVGKIPKIFNPLAKTVFNVEESPTKDVSRSCTASCSTPKQSPLKTTKSPLGKK